MIRSFLFIHKNLSEGRPSQWTFSKQLGKLQLDCNIHLGPAGNGGREGGQGLHERVADILLSKLNKKKPRDKASPAKKSGNNPFVENLSRMEGNGPKIAETLGNLASMKIVV